MSIKPSLQPHRHPSTPRSDSVASVINLNILGTSEFYDLSSNTPQTQLDHDLAQRQKQQKHPSLALSSRKPSPPSHLHTKPLSRVARACYPFFLSHLHNPYPTLQEKETIVKEATNLDPTPTSDSDSDPKENASTSEVTLTSVSNWFANSRRRCGWVEICAENFGGDVGKMVAVCEKFFGDVGGEVDVDEEVVKKLETMRVKVKAWHADQVKPSNWALPLYNLLMKFSEKEPRGIKVAGIKQPKHICTVSTRTTKRSDQENPTFVAEGQSPSPGNTVISELQSLCISEELDVNIPESETVAGRKRAYDQQDERPLASVRCVSSASSVFSSTSELSIPSLIYSRDEEFRPSKRLRSETASPTPSWSDQDLNFTIDLFDYPLDVMCDVSATEPGSSGARLSGEELKRPISHTFSSDIDEADLTRSVKRARLVDPPHQPQKIHTISQSDSAVAAPAVVDSLTTFGSTSTATENIDDIFVTTYNWDLFSTPATTLAEPHLANLSPPDPALPLDVTLYDWATFSTPNTVSAETELLELLSALTESPTTSSLPDNEHQAGAPVASVNNEPPDPQYWQNKLVSDSGLGDGGMTLPPIIISTCPTLSILPADSLSFDASLTQSNQSLGNGQVGDFSHTTPVPASETLVQDGTTPPGALAEENLLHQVDTSFENWFIFSDLV